nr:transporter substrate-binding domain-containing protein [Micromonospora sp. DSM 115978]
AVTGSTPAQNLAELAPTAEPVLLDTYDLCAQELLDGTVDAVTTDNVILLGYVSQSPDQFRLVENPFTAWPYGIGVSRDDDVFRDFVNDTLELVADNGDWFKAFEATVGTVDVVVPDPPAVDRYDTVGG